PLVLFDWHLGRTRAAVRGGEIFPVHFRGQHGHVGGTRSASDDGIGGGGCAAGVLLGARAGGHGKSASEELASPVVPGGFGRLHGQGTRFSTAYLVAARAHRSTDGRQRDAGRRAAQAGDLRHSAIMPTVVSIRVRDGRHSFDGIARRGRHYLWFAVRAGTT